MFHLRCNTSRHYHLTDWMVGVLCLVIILLLLILYAGAEPAYVPQEMKAPRYTYRAFKFPYPDDPLGLVKEPRQYNHFRRPI